MIPHLGSELADRLDAKQLRQPHLDLAAIVVREFPPIVMFEYCGDLADGHAQPLVRAGGVERADIRPVQETMIAALGIA